MSFIYIDDIISVDIETNTLGESTYKLVVDVMGQQVTKIVPMSEDNTDYIKIQAWLAQNS